MNEDKQQKTNPRSGPGFLEVMVIAIMIAAVTVFGYDKYFAQKIYALDLKGYLRTQKALLVAGEISEEEWKASLDALEHTLNNAAADPTHVILLKDVVLRNGDEINIK
ncbi:hypothetical protein [Desulforhopalus sp. IMCC35007]|uniref:hypothetical protein n=1 Tax=Desulforhopalus sp. IMCC35007 TaxID=2569543 RepID=UPI0010ADC175|nr:hypothetical protein [Desulforhopalus sp. IMCC35007]TKB11280.1 hypothetical protein FCL48_04530 [Desulforhopalus sp. IMCC35007]